jgi:hypothetical protein
VSRFGRLCTVLLCCACTPDAPVDPLDPAAVDDAAKGEGDAEGDAHSGSYVLHATGMRACDCPEVQGFDLCAADLTQLGDAAVVTFTQADGYLVLAPKTAPETLSLTGSITADGSFDLGGLYDLGTVLGEGDLFTRLTGEFTDTDHLTAVLLTRVDGTLGNDVVDCRTEVDLTGERVSDPP